MLKLHWFRICVAARWAVWCLVYACMRRGEMQRTADIVYVYVRIPACFSNCSSCCAVLVAPVCDVASGWDELKQHDVLFLMGGGCHLLTSAELADMWFFVRLVSL
jgi:hypothetical protein